MREFNFFVTVVLIIGISVSIVPSAYGFHFYVDVGKNKTPQLNQESKEDYLTRPTFGLSHQNNVKAVDYGFKINEEKFFLSDNFHTPFLVHPIEIGEKNFFEATVYAEKGLYVQEFLFGIPEIGEAHKAELGIEVWYNYVGEIIDVRAIQKTNVIDEDHIFVIHEKTKCRTFSNEKKCDSTKIQIVFLEPLKDKIMAIKAIDFKNRYQITYLNEGLDVSGKTLNPLEKVLIPSPMKNEGLIEITQTDKYSVIWKSEDGRIFERNTYGSFKQINHFFERFQDSGEPLTRHHSGFVKILEQEQIRAHNVFNATSLESYLPETFAYAFPERDERIDPIIKAKLKVQELIAQKMIEDSNIQTRFSNINS